MAVNTTLESSDEMREIIKRSRVRETKSRKLENKAKQDKFKELCKDHSIVSDYGHRINEAQGTARYPDILKDVRKELLGNEKT